jgi:hypothetical protein
MVKYVSSMTPASPDTRRFRLEILLKHFEKEASSSDSI